MVRDDTDPHEKTALRKGTWSAGEDKKLIAYVTKYGIWNWSQMPKYAGLSRSGKSCRLRWMNYLRPDIKRGDFTREEDEMIIKLHQSLGNRWSAIAARLPKRTDNEIKNHWNSHLKKRLGRIPTSPTDESDNDANHKTLSAPETTPRLEGSSTGLPIPISSSSSTYNPSGAIDKSQTTEETGGNTSEMSPDFQSLWEQAPSQAEDLNMEISNARLTDTFLLPNSPASFPQPIYDLYDYCSNVHCDIW